MESRDDRASTGAGDPGARAPGEPERETIPRPLLIPGAVPAPEFPAPEPPGAMGQSAGAPMDPARPSDSALGAAPPAKPPPARRAFGSFFEVALVVLLALFLALILKNYVAEAYEIRGKSMEPTFEEQQRVMILKVFYGIQRGDIIIFSSVDNPSKDLIKRVIGLPGDVVELRSGEVYVNGSKLDEPYVHHSQEDVRPEKIPSGKYYVLGDNRPDSMDSRKFHPIDATSIKGKVVLRWWPLEKLNSF